MSDLTEFLALIARWGLIPDENQEPGEVRFTAEGSGDTPERKVTGYRGFSATFVFDENGKFVELGVWE